MGRCVLGWEGGGSKAVGSEKYTLDNWKLSVILLPGVRVVGFLSEKESFH